MSKAKGQEAPELTPEQIAKAEPWARRWREISMSTTPMSQEEYHLSALCARELYARCGLTPPTHVFFYQSPMQCAVAAGMDIRDKKHEFREFKPQDQPTSKEFWYVAPWLDALKGSVALADGLRTAMGGWQGGNLWPSYCAYISFCRHIVKVERDYAAWDCWEKLAIHSGPRIVTQDAVYISDRPILYTLDRDDRPHNESGPYIKWADGSAFYSWHGNRAPAWCFEEKHRLTPPEIEGTQNIELRRVMIEIYGTERYVLDSGAKLIHKDDWGELFRKDEPGDEPILMVRVVNSTAEPDGSFRNYFCMVHPELRPLKDGRADGPAQELTARNAVASTFGLLGHEYQPVVET